MIYRPTSCIKLFCSNTWMFHVKGHYCTQLCPWSDWGFGIVVKCAQRHPYATVISAVRKIGGFPKMFYITIILYTSTWLFQMCPQIGKIKSFMFWRRVVSMFYQNCRYYGSQASSSISSKVDEALQSVSVFWTDLPAALEAGSRKFSERLHSFVDIASWIYPICDTASYLRKNVRRKLRKSERPSKFKARFIAKNGFGWKGAYSPTMSHNGITSSILLIS